MTFSGGLATLTDRKPDTPIALDLEKQPTTATVRLERLDIEHSIVENDPRRWSSTRKWIILAIVSAASMVAGLATTIQNPANQNIEETLHASPSQISLSLSLFILVQGFFPMLWSAVSEIKGRKILYLLSITIFAVGSVVVAISHSIGLFIGMRVIQAIGSSAVLAIGAGTLADIYDPAERGSKFGLYYGAPLLGPSVGAILGGGLTQGFGWRAVFWFLAIFAGCNLLSFLLLFKETFRKERSSTYQTVLKRRIMERAQESHSSSQEAIAAGTRTVEAPPLKAVKLSLKDVNPFPPQLLILRRTNNLVILFSSGVLFAFSISISYTCARTMANKYDYDALKTGLVLLAGGIGSILGSILGGKWSDRQLARLKAAQGGKSEPEMRLRSTIVAMLFLPLSAIGYAWVCQRHVHVAAVCVMLFLCGFFNLWIYSSTLAYIVDANVGRSSTAVATNSAFRGISGLVAAEVAIPLQDAIGDGGMYTLWAGFLVICELLIVLLLFKGQQWRQRAETRETQKLQRQLNLRQSGVQSGAATSQGQ